MRLGLDCKNPNTLHDELTRALCRGVERGLLRPWDAQLALFFAQQAPAAPWASLLAAALCSQEAARGQVYLDLDTLAECDDPLLAEWSRHFAHWHAWPQQAPDLFGIGEGATPLVVADGCLYLRRFWRDERCIAEGIAARLTLLPLPAADQVRELLDQLFPVHQTAPDWQRIACTLMLSRPFGVISGGPGTGKTTTVLRLLLLLQGLAMQDAIPGQCGPLRVRLAAPTGKAAARLGQSLHQALQREEAKKLLPTEALRQIPSEVETVHRLLGLRDDGKARYHRARPLAVDVLVIDEASMLSQELMARVLDALPPAARLILLGDKDQLASVEAGAVLAELCVQAEAARYRDETRAWIAATCAYELPAPATVGSEREQCLALLRHSYRFGAESGIGRLAEKIRQGDSEGLPALFSAAESDLRNFSLEDQERLDQLLLHGWPGDPEAPGYLFYLQQLRAGLRQGLDADLLAQQSLSAFGNFQLLCARREGPLGVQGMNERIVRLLQAKAGVPRGREWFAGRPVMVTRNLYSLQLMNGEVGMTLPVRFPDGRLELRVAFSGSRGEVRWFSPARLRDIETVFALTVHKSQGSEYQHCAFLAAADEAEVLYRELLYTAVTRARSRLSLIVSGELTLLDEMIRRPLRRQQRIFTEVEEKRHG